MNIRLNLAGTDVEKRVGGLHGLRSQGGLHSGATVPGLAGAAPAGGVRKRWNTIEEAC